MLGSMADARDALNAVQQAALSLCCQIWQVLYQTKTLSTAIFSVIILKKTFPIRQWMSFVLLALSVVVVQSQDAK